MYEELYKVWQREIEKTTLEELPQDFYVKAAQYLKKIKEETRMIDKKTLKASLLQSELQNVKRMLQELIQIRHKKLLKETFEGKEVPPNILTDKEKGVYQKILPISESLQDFTRQILEGHYLAAGSERETKIVVLRFLRDVPAVVGRDLKIYGPFKAEDVASLPTENANILIKQGLAERVNIG